MESRLSAPCTTVSAWRVGSQVPPRSGSVVARCFPAADAIRYALSCWAGLSLFLDDGHVEIDCYTVERAIRTLALNRKNALFAGSDGGGKHWAVFASLVETCKLIGVEPLAYLADVITRIVEGHPHCRLDELLPWADPSTPKLQAVALERRGPGGSVRGCEQGPEQRLGLAQSFVGQHHRLGASTGSAMSPLAWRRPSTAQSKPFQAQRPSWSVSHKRASTASSMRSSSTAIQTV